MSGAALAFVASDNASPDDKSILGVFIVVINVYGLLMSMKHYERSRQHVTVAAEYRTTVSGVSPIGDVTINEVREQAKAEHATNFPRLRKVRAYVLWAGLHIVLGFLGVRFLF
jgi:hypothetical protein